MTTKTMICIPCMDTFPTDTVKSLMSLQRYSDTILGWSQGTLIHIAREQLAESAMNAMPEDGWTLWLDSDMTFPPDLLSHLIDVAEKNRYWILGTVCYRRKQPYTPVLFSKLEIDTQTGGCKELEQILPPSETEPFEVEGIGMACVLIHTRVFREVRQKYGLCFNPLGVNSEDLSFMWKARKCGFKIFVDPTPNIGHVGQLIYGKETLKQK